MASTRTVRPTGIRRLRLLFVALAALLLTMGVTAAPASAGEHTGFNQSLTNGRCQSVVTDEDCYHYVGHYNTHQGCFNKMGAILGVDPSTDQGKYVINNIGQWYCPARPPVGYYYLYVYQSSPPCAVGVPFYQCP